jgi:hypothetical protein
MKRFVLSIGTLALLAACGGGGEEVACDQAYWDGTVGTCIPDGWQVVDRATLDQRQVPEETVVAFQAEQPYSGQFPIVVVTREQLTQEVESGQYSELSVESVKGLPQYEEIDVRTVTIDGNDVSLHIYSAQPDEGEPKARFYQVSIVSGTTGYAFTGGTPLGVQDEIEDQILLILENATLLPPEEEEEE